MGIVGSLTFLLLIFQSLHFGISHLNMSVEHLMFTAEMKEDKITLSCIIQDKQSDSGESFNVDIIGLIMSRSNQNHSETLAELYKTQPEQVYVSNFGIMDAKGSISNDTYLIVMLDTEKPRFVEYQCDVIFKVKTNEGEIRVIFSKLGSEMYSSKNRNDIDAVKFLHTRLNADVDEVVLSEINEEPVLGKTRLVKRSVSREANVTDLQTNVNGSEMTLNAIKSIPGMKSLDEDYEQMSGKLTDMRSRLRRFKKNMNDSTMNKRLLLGIEDNRNVHNVISHVRLQNFNHQAQLKNFSDELKKTLTDILTANQWPSGTYSLLKPSSGCPSSGNVLWKEGFVLFHTESSDGINTDSYSFNSHLSNPIKSQKNNNNFMTFHFCSKSNEDNEELDWPKGSYCINKLGNCLDGFGGGKIHLDQEDTNFQGNVSGIVPWDNTNHDLHFCCRKDGSPMSHITLPRVSDFYLYRYGGRCQNVFGMTFTEEYVLLDTENSGNNDSLNPPHPDATIKDVNITLCYYEFEVKNL